MGTPGTPETIRHVRVAHTSRTPTRRHRRRARRQPGGSRGDGCRPAGTARAISSIRPLGGCHLAPSGVSRCVAAASGLAQRGPTTPAQYLRGRQAAAARAARPAETTRLRRRGNGCRGPRLQTRDSGAIDDPTAGAVSEKTGRHPRGAGVVGPRPDAHAHDPYLAHRLRDGAASAAVRARRERPDGARVRRSAPTRRPTEALLCKASPRSGGW